MIQRIRSGHGQVVMIWWGLSFTAIYAVCIIFLLRMVPPPDPALPAEDIARFYIENRESILLGATICSWTSAFMVPIASVLAIQLARLQEGVRSWAILCFAGGILMSMFLVFPPIMWGTAAFTATRAPEATALLHELALLTLVTTDQYFIFQMVPLAYVSLAIRRHDRLSAAPRWLGYATLWIALAFEAGALAFLTKSGPFSWKGGYVFWVPLVAFGVWIAMISFAMLRAIHHQRKQEG